MCRGFIYRTINARRARLKYVLSVIKGYDFEKHGVQRPADEAVPGAEKEFVREAERNLEQGRSSDAQEPAGKTVKKVALFDRICHWIRKKITKQE